ncbi:ribosomal protein L7/L12 [Ralstonia pickettii]|uniref:50S ribosomal protein L7/L12 n=1 Tax=Ralstonia pickettii TaxID=329 RepID=A0AAW4QAL3_RALPI|nr:hypothetical protein [Ralstonia pickettii]MBX3886495.1 hypothetical protein [Ralstonia pickettii]MBX3891428.1 hypothetical protein [Ralstonia pickettii]
MDEKAFTEGDSATAAEIALLERCKALLQDGQRVEAVKTYRSATGASLHEAQRALGIR